MDCKPLTAVLYALSHNQFFKHPVFCKIIIVAITIVFNKQPSSANSGQPLLILMTKIMVCRYFLLLVTPHKNHGYTATGWTVIYSLLCIRPIHESFFAHWYIFARTLNHSCILCHLNSVLLGCVDTSLGGTGWSGSNGSTEMGTTVKVEVSQNYIPQEETVLFNTAYYCLTKPEKSSQQSSALKGCFWNLAWEL